MTADTSLAGSQVWAVDALGVALCRPSEAVLDLLPSLQHAAFAKEDGQQMVDPAGNRISA